MKTCLWNETFITEVNATRITLILNAKRYGYDFKKTYETLYPLLCKRSKEIVDKTLPQITRLTKKEYQNAECVLCHERNCKEHGKRWKIIPLIGKA